MHDRGADAARHRQRVEVDLNGSPDAGPVRYRTERRSCPAVRRAVNRMTAEGSLLPRPARSEDTILSGSGTASAIATKSVDRRQCCCNRHGFQDMTDS